MNLRLLMAASAIGSIPSGNREVVIKSYDYELGFGPLRKKLIVGRPIKKCLLKDCARMTQHNGGYCCAEHCRKDRNK